MTQITIEPQDNVKVTVRYEYRLEGAGPIQYIHGVIKFFPEIVIVNVVNGELADVTALGYRALVSGHVGVDHYRNYYLPEDFYLMPKWLLNLSQVAVLNAANAGLVP